MAIQVSCSSGESSTQLAAAILLYKCDKKVNFVSMHPVEYINDDLSKPYIGAGQPVSKMVLSKLIEDLNPSTFTQRTILPENILSYDAEHIVWYTLPAKKQMWFRNEEFGGEVTANIDLPGLVFYVVNGTWYVFAHKLNKRPDADTSLFVSPFLNVWDSGKICTGNITVPKIVSPASTAAFEDAFFRSYFTHINIREKNKLVKHPGGPYKLWQQLITGEIKKLPMKALVPFKATVGDFFTKLNQRNNHD